MDFRETTTEGTGMTETPLVPVEAELVESPRPATEYVVYHRRKVRLPVFLFLATCMTTFYVGCQIVEPTGVARWAQVQMPWGVENLNLHGGLVYMTAVMSILLAHEMGHFIQALRYHVPASLPFFIPVPLAPIGTMGAVIGMPGTNADRKQMFDIGISGPLAGLVIALPVVWFGIQQSPVLAASPELLGGHGLTFGDPLLFKFLFRLAHPDQPTGAVYGMTPLLQAGWVGLLVTGLNMVPISQLDGGHVSYALFLKKAHLIARAFLVMAVVSIVLFDLYSWTLMLMLILFIGSDHPPTRDDSVELGWGRRILGYASLAIPIFCLTPVPLSLS